MKKIISAALVAIMLTGNVAFANDYPQKFGDVSSNHWAFQYIADLADKGIINGYDDGSFHPERTVSRAEWAKIIVDAAGVTVNDNSVSFNDMSSTHWANKYVNAAKDYLEGYADGTFRPELAVTREDVTVSIIKILGFDLSVVDSLMKYEEVLGFLDTDDMPDTSKTCIKLATDLGLMQGYDDGTFRGQNSLSRGEAAAIICRAFIYSDPNMVIATENSIKSRVEWLNNLTKDNIYDKNGLRIADFPCQYDYDKIKELFTDEFGNTDNISFKEGVISENTPMEHHVVQYHFKKHSDASSYGVKYILAEMPLSDEEFAESFSESDESDIIPSIKVDKNMAYMYYFDPHIMSGWTTGWNQQICSDVVLPKDKYDAYWKEYDLLYNEGWIRSIKEYIIDNTGVFDHRTYESYINELCEYIIDYIITDDMTEIEKIKAVHNWLIANSAYDMKAFNDLINSGNVDEFLNNSNLSNSFSIYAPLVYGKSLCGGYAATFERFMKMLNIECIMVDGTAANFGEKFSEATNHAWNMVKIDDNWYHIDVTWDNPSKNVTTGEIKYDYFLISDRQMSAKRQWNYGSYCSGVFNDTPTTYDHQVNGQYVSEPMPKCVREIDVGFDRSIIDYQKPFK